jgi:hypothetical protein
MTKVEPPYNPLDKKHLGESVAGMLLAREIQPLPPAEPFIGAGLYAIYYTGAFEAYRPIATRNAAGAYQQPIYVGKAVPAGARKGGYGLGEDPGRVLYNRLREHAESIEQAKNIDLKDFACRYLVADDIWIPLGEALLIQRFRPLWNHHLDGFGNHDPGAGRYQGRRSAWDVLHAGRPWAERLAEGARPEGEVIAGITEFLGRGVEAAGDGPRGRPVKRRAAARRRRV